MSFPLPPHSWFLGSFLIPNPYSEQMCMQGMVQQSKNKAVGNLSGQDGGLVVAMPQLAAQAVAPGIQIPTGSHRCTVVGAARYLLSKDWITETPNCTTGLIRRNLQASHCTIDPASWNQYVLAPKASESDLI
jgi:hypothetical protein